MTPATIESTTTRVTDLRVIALVGSAHFVSHVFMLVLPPVFPLVRAEFGVSYTELGFVVAIFNVISAILQTPAGFLVDRTSARAVLVGGLLLGSAALIAAAMAPAFLLLGVAFAFLGLGNTVYHPANYSLLSNRVSAGRVSQAFSIHIFGGFIGTAITPAAMVILATAYGSRAAFMATALLGVAVAAAILLFGEPLSGRKAARAETADAAAPAANDWRVLATWPVVLNLIFFMLIASSAVGIQNYGIVALEALWKMPLPLATTAITAHLLLSAFAVLAGGFIAAHYGRHETIALIGLAASGLALLPIAFIDPGATLLIALMGLSGFFNGVMQPARDMIVRGVTPPGAFGRVFGFVTTGFNIGGVLAPPAFGYMMDVGAPASVIVGTAVCALSAIPVVLISVVIGRRRSRAET